MRGWVIDAQLGATGRHMDVWIIDVQGNVNKISIPWCAHIHVHAENRLLSNLPQWLNLPEIKEKFSVGSIRMVKRRLSLDEFEMHNVLEIDVLDSRKIRKISQHIEARGDHHRYSLFSVDAHLAQRFFIEFGISPFRFVEWDGDSFSLLNENDIWPKMKVIELNFEYHSNNGFDTLKSYLTRIEIFQWDGFLPEKKLDFVVQRKHCGNEFLANFQDCINRLNPDIIITKGGDALHLAALDKLAKKVDFDLNLSRVESELKPRSMSRVVHSYGQVIRKDAYFPLNGRLHIDLNASFIVREGGILGLFELSRHSRQSPQDISRLSPGSVISAIQMRIAMEDGVLVPWKKNRAEDTKTAWELLVTDRGGLYLDSKPGVYSDVIELDFASLFPSIIATRNISPETLNCACCQTTTEFPTTEMFVPLSPDDAERTFRKRARMDIFSSKIFPSANASALQVPGLKTHTCARTHGFLGRVVAPIIERRMQLKSQRKRKGDLFDLQQNALKWLLVTCFGYTGYKNARFGRIEAHEAICAWARDILLATISIAEDEGWDVLHAIVDCVWIENKNLKTREEKIVSAMHLSKKVSKLIGIPLEFEDIYDFIGFLPSRMHGAGSLTKYWAHGQNGFKLRGIEARQHSTCQWITSLQKNSLKILKDNLENGGKYDSVDVQQQIITMLHDEIGLLNSGEINPKDLVVTRRVTKRIQDFSVSTNTQQALIRARRLGQDILPGRKVRFVATKPLLGVPESRVALLEELSENSKFKIDSDYYQNLAIRAIWAILGPFGWSDEEIKQGRKKYTLFDFFDAFNSKPSSDDSAY
ncbi:MAG: DNA polymerase domain-containing protein [Candidatus Poseidoniaceae archaeon]